MSKELKLNISRTVEATELDDLIFGTGALGFPWWDGAHKTDGGYRFTHTAKDGAEGTFTGNTWRSNQQIVTAAARFFGEGRGPKDAMFEDLGYLDAAEADTVLQYAIFREAVFG